MNNNDSKLEERVSALEQRITALENKMITQAARSKNLPMDKKKLLSEKEYLLSKRPKDDVQRTFFLGNYLEEYKQMESFTAEDLKGAFRAAREPVPGNINDKINKNIAKGLFMEVELKDGKKAWVLTATGEKVVNEIPNENGIK